MGRIRDPKLFSQEFGIDAKKLAKLRLLDPILNADTKLFIDPVLLQSSSNKAIKAEGLKHFSKYFGNVIRLLSASKVVGDLAWRTAALHLKLDELPQLCLGFGGNTTRGRSIAKVTKKRVLATAKEIVELGIKDPELFSLVGLLEEGVGPDTIGDMTAHAILPTLVAITEAAARELKIKVRDAHISGIDARLPYNKYSRRPLLLVPEDILRDLPVATDWSDVAEAASANAEIRARVNKFIGDIWRMKTKEQKDTVRTSALANVDAFRSLLDAVYLLSEDSYDFAADPEGHRVFREALRDFATKFPLKLKTPKLKNRNELVNTVDRIVEHFKTLVEKNGVNYLLWDGTRRRKEKAAQRLFFAVADVYCKANNVDISPETDSGAGPVDFKFSSGYGGRVLVEIKLSTGKVVHGYTTQIGVYEDAAKTTDSVYLVIDVGGLDAKLKTIMKTRNDRVARGEPAPKIVVVDGALKPSASKR
jgi:hypothetical protein